MHPVGAVEQVEEVPVSRVAGFQLGEQGRFVRAGAAAKGRTEQRTMVIVGEIELAETAEHHLSENGDADRFPKPVVGISHFVIPDELRAALPRSSSV